MTLNTVFTRTVRSAALAVVSAIGLYSLYAFAGERFLGVLTLSGSKYINVQGLSDGGISGFPIGGKALITVQSNVDSFVCINQKDPTTQYPNCSAVNGLRVPANAALPTSCPPSTNTVLPVAVTLPDGGPSTVLVNTTSCIIEVLTADGGTGSAKVFQRNGDEM